jgi:hypothetical protein
MTKLVLHIHCCKIKCGMEDTTFSFVSSSLSPLANIIAFSSASLVFLSVCALVKAEKVLIVVRYTYKNTSAGSLLRKYLVHHTAYRHPFDEDVSSYVNLPVEFLAAVMVNSSRRLPYTQCGECYGKALKATSVLGPEVDERDPATDIPPYKTDMCLYHEHTNDEERKACHLRREGAKSAA